MKYVVTERQVVEYTWEVDSEDVAAAGESLEEALEAVDGVPDRAISKLIRSETSHRQVEDGSDEWTCPGCGRRVQPSDVRRHASECEKYDGSQGY